MPRLSSLCALAALFCSVSFVRADTPILARNTASRTVSGVMPLATRTFRALGVLSSKASVVRVRVLTPAASRPTSKTALGAPRSAADGSLLFDYEGFSAENKRVLSTFVSRNYGAMVARYGQPSPEQRAFGGKTIKVVGNAGIAAAYQPLLKPNNSPRGDGGTIFFTYNNGISEEANQFNFTRLVLRAFQGPNNFSYNYNAGSYNDTYQAGLADAVALLVLFDSLSADKKASFDPADYDTSVLHLYDVLNRPELAGPYIFPAFDDPRPDKDSILPDFRLNMAQAAWLKVGIENPDFFKNFNAAYYAAIPARQAATSNQLRNIAAGAAPTVEGLSFQDWARRQYVLDNSVTTGTKILALVLPVQTPAGANQITGFQGLAEAFTTGANGRDTRLIGVGTIDAFDENGVNINAQSPELSVSNLLTLKQSSDTADFRARFRPFGAPDRARIAIQLKFKGAQTTALFPYIGTGGAASQTTIYGVSAQGSSGSLSLSNNAGSETVAVSRGAFSGTKKYVSGPRVITKLTLNGRTYQRNTAWLPGGKPGERARGVDFVLEGAARDDSFAFKTPSGASGVRMISLPLFPTQSDEAAILGIAAKDLKLARYRPNLVPGVVAGGNLTFGINADRHELYPQISAPIAPGRGYWLGAGEISRTVQGSEPRTDLPFEIALPGGWNQFGVPFNKAFSPDAIRVKYGSFAAVTYPEAVKNGLVGSGIWRWQGRGGYARADGASGASLAPFEGFYIYAIPARGVSLIFIPNVTTATNALSAASSAPENWSVSLSASTDSARDSSNRFGVSDAVPAAKPPTGPPVVTLHFASSGNADTDASGAGAASGWADSFLAKIERTGKWEFAVDGTRKSESVALSWGDLKSLPADLKLVLRDEKTRKTLALRAGGSYKWSSDGASRGFSIVATRSAQASLRVVAAPSRGAEISVSLSLRAHGRLEIQNAAGDTVWKIKTGDFGVKPEKFAWRGEQIGGNTAARGRYRAVWIPTLEADRGAARDFDWRP